MQATLQSCETRIKQHNYEFPPGATGPFGDDLEGNWLDYETAQRTLIFHRRDYFNMPNAVNFGFWCDWHAKV